MLTKAQLAAIRERNITPKVIDAGGGQVFYLHPNKDIDDLLNTIDELRKALSDVLTCYEAITRQEQVKNLVNWGIREAVVNNARRTLGEEVSDVH